MGSGARCKSFCLAAPPASWVGTAARDARAPRLAAKPMPRKGSAPAAGVPTGDNFRSAGTCARGPPFNTDADTLDIIRAESTANGADRAKCAGWGGGGGVRLSRIARQGMYGARDFQMPLLPTPRAPPSRDQPGKRAISARGGRRNSPALGPGRGAKVLLEN